jgi:excinuclease ABC subunit C
LNYDLKLCPAPCVDKISKKEYKKNIDNIILFLKGESRKLLDKISKEMYTYAK